jgi:hypothetical protein
MDVAGWMVFGTVRPLTLNPLPDTVSLVIVSAARPSFQMVMESVLLLPLFTLPKLADVGLNTTNPCAAARLAFSNPASSVANTINNRAKRPPTSFSFSWKFVFSPWFLIAPTA